MNIADRDEWGFDELHEAVDILLNRIVFLEAEDKRLRFIVDSIPDDVWDEMKTWESMEGVIE